MKKTRAISLLLSLSLICAMLVPGAAAFAENEGGSGDSGMVISKTATANTDGSYTITLEAYATGEKVISEVTEDVPTDIVLVLDQSGSMEDPIGAVSFSAYSDRQSRNNQHYDRRHNGGSANLWYKDGEKYYSVSVTKTITYTALSESLDNYDYYYYRNNLYEKVGDDEYEKVGLTYSTSGFLGLTYTFTYTFSDNTSVNSVGWNTKPYSDLRSNGHAPLYTPAADNNDTVYTYTYTDAGGVTRTIGTSTGATKVPDFTLYERTVDESAGGSRLNALKTAVTSFATAVAKKAAGADKTLGTADDVNHRIAMVGFASGNPSNTLYYNSEVFVGSNQYQYNTTASEHYAEALQSMKTTQGKDNITASINALDAEGGTYTNLGLEMANGILTQNPVQTGEKRNRVIIVFTDGVPGRSGWDSNVATAAINQAQTAKNNGVTVYTVGIFSGADATSAGSESGNESQKANWFMQNLSSNNGTPQTPSYYLSAADAGTLNNIFQQISDQIETGGSETTLGSETVVKDIISPYFTLPAGTTASGITLETYKCTGKNGDAYIWENNNDAMGATAVIGSTDTDDATTTNNQVSVTGFDFAENYVGTVNNNGTVTYRGNKLVISFKVKPRPGFLGGNAVYTNTSAGVYENGSSTDPVLTFERPNVDVTIKEPTITLPDANVYLGAYFSETVNADDLKAGTSIKFGDNIVLDLTKPDQNWGLADWQTEYVTITVTVTDKDGNEVTEFDKLMDDTEYKVSVSIKPKTPKDGNNGYDESMGGTIHVFKPVLTFKDSTAYYGEAVPANNDYSSNKVGSEVWKHGDITSTDEGVTMLGTKPSLEITYTPDSSKIVDGKYTKQDVPVKATVKIGTDDVSAYTTFIHQDCTDETWTGTNGDPAFMVHIKTCTLTITKAGEPGKDLPDEPFVFTVKKDGVKYTEVTIVGNGTETIYELPVGTYTIAEDTGWSWRFSPSYSVDKVTLSNSNTEGTITCTNTLNKPYWLNGFSQVVTNIFGTTNN